MDYSLHNVEVEVSLGVLESEKVQKQKVFVSVFWQSEVTEAQVKNDDIESVVDYSQVHEIIMSLADKPHTNLIEKMYFDFRNDLEKVFPETDFSRIWIKKTPFETGSISVGS